MTEDEIGIVLAEVTEIQAKLKIIEERQKEVDKFISDLKKCVKPMLDRT